MQKFHFLQNKNKTHANNCCVHISNNEVWVWLNLWMKMLAIDLQCNRGSHIACSVVDRV